MKKVIFGEDELGRRAAIISGGDLWAYFVDVEEDVGAIYRGVVRKVVPALDSAFVEIDRGLWGMLHIKDIPGRPPGATISSLLRIGQPVLVQVKRGPIGDKGPKLSCYVTVPGKFLVLLPFTRGVRVSRKLPEGVRTHLQRAVAEVLGEQVHTTGVVVRTSAGFSGNLENITEEFKQLRTIWEAIRRRFKGGNKPALLYSPPDFFEKALMDFVPPDADEISVAGENLYERIKAVASRKAPSLAGKISLYPGDDPFEDEGVDSRLRDFLVPRFQLPSGGYIVIQGFEALTVVDVNSGRFVFKGSIEDTAAAVNTEAAREIPRQLRVRDIGGRVVVDFIDMESKQNWDKVLSVLREGLLEDRAKTTDPKLMPFGLVVFSRKRTGFGLSSMEPEEIVAKIISKEARKRAKTYANPVLLILANKRVATALIGPYGDGERDLEASTGKKICIRGMEGYDVGRFSIRAIGETFPVAEKGERRRLFVEDVYLYDEVNAVSWVSGVQFIIEKGARHLFREVEVETMEVSCSFVVCRIVREVG